MIIFLVKAGPNTSTLEILECSDGFYRENGSSICIPSCYDWDEFGRVNTIAIDVIFHIFVVLGTIACIFILIFGCVDSKRM